ncbi:biogenesis of lysosome-related organelles complex 1 subunit 4 [Nematostella vectensis]|uniref:biogenesis of lysosome-related organelles complex 1 subunit 4 n=1 Tax=Nematostella vectensis TaxID=45351 RepID=UPI00139048E1|nr:biogenesis of lysosome-related organelles complex 1 subunit 4 [Nematostella vectensis]
MAQSRETESQRVEINKQPSIDLRKCASDYAPYIDVDVRNEVKGIEAIIEEMLAKLDEFSHLADTIRNDSSQILFISLPELCNKCQELPSIFNKIDHLEAFLRTVRRNVDEMEETVDIAEEDLGTHSIKKVLHSIPYLGLTKKKQPVSIETPKTEWKRPEVFSTSSFFGPRHEEKHQGLGKRLDTEHRTEGIS